MRKSEQRWDCALEAIPEWKGIVVYSMNMAGTLRQPGGGVRCSDTPMRNF